MHNARCQPQTSPPLSQRGPMVQAEYNAELARALLRRSPLTLEERQGWGWEPSGRTWWNRIKHMGRTLGCLPPFQGLIVCFVPVTGVWIILAALGSPCKHDCAHLHKISLTLHPGLCSASPSGLLLAGLDGGRTPGLGFEPMHNA